MPCLIRAWPPVLASHSLGQVDPNLFVFHGGHRLNCFDQNANQPEPGIVPATPSWEENLNVVCIYIIYIRLYKYIMHLSIDLSIYRSFSICLFIYLTIKIYEIHIWYMASSLNSFSASARRIWSCWSYGGFSSTASWPMGNCVVLGV